MIYLCEEKENTKIWPIKWYKKKSVSDNCVLLICINHLFYYRTSICSIVLIFLVEFNGSLKLYLHLVRIKCLFQQNIFSDSEKGVAGTMDMKMIPVVVNASILTGLDARKTPTRLCDDLRSYRRRDTYSVGKRRDGHSRIAGPCFCGNPKIFITVLLLANQPCNCVYIQRNYNCKRYSRVQSEILFLCVNEDVYVCIM